MRTLWISKASLAIVAMTASPVSAQDCGEPCLLDLATSYLDGLGVADPSEVPLSPHHRLWVNGQLADTSSDIWRNFDGWSYRHTVADPVNRQAVTLGVIYEGEAQDFIAVRVREDAGQIVESEILLSREGDFSLFRPAEVRDANPIFGSFLPADRRQSRAELEQVARGYFEGLINGDASRTAFHPDCNRVENNVATTNARVGGSSCSEGVRRFSYMRGYHNLRFPVIDPARGLVMTVLFIDMPEQRRTIMVRGEPIEISPERNHLPRSLYLFELFKIEDGRIRRIEAVLRNEPYGTQLPFGGEEAQGPALAPE